MDPGEKQIRVERRNKRIADREAWELPPDQRPPISWSTFTYCEKCKPLILQLLEKSNILPCTFENCDTTTLASHARAFPPGTKLRYDIFQVENIHAFLVQHSDPVNYKMQLTGGSSYDIDPWSMNYNWNFSDNIRSLIMEELS